MTGLSDPWASGSTSPIVSGYGFSSTGSAGTASPKQAIDFSYLVNFIDILSQNVKSQIAILRSKGSAMSIADMFDLQMGMQKLTQFSETANSVIAAMNTSITSMARNMKG